MEQITQQANENLPVGIVGLGLMGCSIATCLLMAGHPVIATAPIPEDLVHAHSRISEHLRQAKAEGLVTKDVVEYLQRLEVTGDYQALKPCWVVMECTIENLAIKEKVYAAIERVVGADTLLTSNTSAIPITQLQQLTHKPGRFYGLHWSEPAHVTRFLEIICGNNSEPAGAEWLYRLAHSWGKEPTLVRRDIRGFITNRLMYAMYREAFYLVENGYATVEDVDRACRNNACYWMTFAGVFRWMDLTGVPAYHTVLKDLFPELSTSTAVPALIDDIVNAGGRGVANGKGFYQYTPEEAKAWEDTFREFSYEIRKLALKYPEDVVQRKLNKQ